jgi:hypothetical protein
MTHTIRVGRTQRETNTGDDEMNATRKQTAGNNAFLAKVKRAMNGKAFARTAEIMNRDGEAAAREFMQGFFISPVDEALDGLVAMLDAR